MKVLRIRLWFLFVFSVMLIVLAWVNAEWLTNTFGVSNASNDAINALNTLFTGLAFAGVIAAILLQERQLESQARDIERQSEESRKAVKHQQEQLNFVALTCYLSALGDLSDAPPHANQTPDQTHALQRIERVIEVLQPQAEKLAVGISELPSREMLFAKKLRELIAEVRAVVIPEDGTSPEQNFEKITEKVDPAQERFRELTKGFSDDELKELAANIEKLFGQCNSQKVKQLKRSHTKQAHGEEGFRTYVEVCETLISKVNQLAERLESVNRGQSKTNE